LIDINRHRRWAMFQRGGVAGIAWIAYSANPGAAQGGGPPPSPAQGFRAPEIHLSDAAGASHSLSDYRGQVVVLNFWASWCPPCRAEMPAIERIHNELAGEGLTILAANATRQDSRAAALSFAHELGLTLPILFDDDGSAEDLFHIRALPTTFFIDRKGIIRHVVVGGPLAGAVIESMVRDLLREGD
jgi:thiol-disulfide isomerase/thioredoxin